MKSERLGQQVGSYEIVSLLGAGGMGEVYLARDATLGRKVALKFLPDFLLQDDTARRRFVQEAKLAAALDHPFLCKVYEIGEEDERVFISLEYVRGQTLREKLAEGPLAVQEAWKIAAEIAEALSVAHQRGIVHRDLKPSNIMFTPDGHVKVMDFGLAKQLIHPEGQEQSLTGMTKTGTTVGTLPYMSPEQVRGQKVDTRSDLFSFGVILYEMLTGEHPFRRSLAADTAVAILGKEPEPVGKLRPEVTEELESVLMKLLAKDREDRWQTVEEVRSSLAQLASDPSSSSMALAAGKGTAFSGLASRVALALVAVAAVAAAWLWFARPQPQVMLQPVPLTSLPGNERYPSFSPDGNEVAFAWSGKNQENSDIWVKQIDTETRRNLTDNPANDTAPAWSPDGLQIAFVRNLGGEQSEIRLIPSRGGTDHPVTEINARRTTLAWSRDSQWLAVSAGENSDEPWAIFLVSVETGEKRRLTSPDLSATGGDIFPAFSPDNRGLAFSRSTGGNNRHIYLLRLSADYQREGVPEQLTRETGFYGGPVWTLDGREIVFSFGSQINPRLYRISVSDSEPMRLLNLSHGPSVHPALSAKQGRLAFVNGGGDLNIVRFELPGPGASGSAATRPQNFISTTRLEGMASYSHDGKRIAFRSSRSGSPEIWVCNSDGTRVEPLTSFNDPANPVGGPRWSPDGKQVSFMCPLEGNSDICVIGSGGGSETNLTEHPAGDGHPSWSRDGKWIYFSSDRSGDQQIWKMLATGGEPEQVTKNGGFFALESPDGVTLYFSRVVGGQWGLWTMPVGGVGENFVSEIRRGTSFAVAHLGVYFFSDLSTLKFLPFDTGEAIHISPAPDLTNAYFTSVSPDGRWGLLQKGELQADLMLVENFR